MAELKAKQIRRHLKMSREEVGEHFGVSSETVKRWEIVDGALRLMDAIELARLYGVSLDQLTGLAPLPWEGGDTVEYHFVSLRDLTDAERAKVEAFAEGLKAGR